MCFIDVCILLIIARSTYLMIISVARHVLRAKIIFRRFVWHGARLTDIIFEKYVMKTMKVLLLAKTVKPKRRFYLTHIKCNGQNKCRKRVCFDFLSTKDFNIILRRNVIMWLISIYSEILKAHLLDSCRPIESRSFSFKFSRSWCLIRANKRRS